jgi:hypothetical protein
MPTPDKDLMTRLTELVNEHSHRWKKIAPIIAAEGYRDAKDKPYSDNYLRQRMRRQEKEDSSTGARHSEGSKYKDSEAVKPSEQPALDVPELARAVISLLLQERTLELAVKEVVGNLERSPLELAHEMPPQPERVTDRRWEKLAGTCDCELVKLFHGKRRELRLSVSQMLDYVLWSFFGKPPLSYQSKGSETSKESRDEAHVGSSYDTLGKSLGH